MTEPTLPSRVVARNFATSPPRCRWRTLGAVGAIVGMLSACAGSAEMPVDRDATAREHAAAGIATVQSSPFVLEPRPAGEPLPAPNRAVAGNWPAEVRSLIVAMVALFPRAPTRKFDLQEIASRLHIAFEGEPMSLPRIGVERDYAIRDWKLTGPEPSWRPSLSFMRPGLGDPFVIAFFPVDTSRYCINPYEFAVYTGARYSPMLPTDGLDPYKPIEPRYQWGMFDNPKAAIRTYEGSDGAAIATDGKCIHAFTMKSHEPEDGQ